MSGLAHLLAISGLHIGLVAGIIFFAVRALLALIEPLALRLAIKKWAAGAALIGALGYMLLSGASVPTQRAFLMTGLVLIAVMLDRTSPPGMRCDGLGCIQRVGGQTVALVKDPRALAEDCALADVVVSIVPVRSQCPAAHTVIDRFDLWRSGTHAIWLDDHGARVESVAKTRGNRPWTGGRRRARKK